MSTYFVIELCHCDVPFEIINFSSTLSVILLSTSSRYDGLWVCKMQLGLRSTPVGMQIDH